MDERLACLSSTARNGAMYAVCTTPCEGRTKRKGQHCIFSSIDFQLRQHSCALLLCCRSLPLIHNQRRVSRSPHLRVQGQCQNRPSTGLEATPRGIFITYHLSSPFRSLSVSRGHVTHPLIPAPHAHLPPCPLPLLNSFLLPPYSQSFFPQTFLSNRWQIRPLTGLTFVSAANTGWARRSAPDPLVRATLAAHPIPLQLTSLSRRYLPGSQHHLRRRSCHKVGVR